MIRTIAVVGTGQAAETHLNDYQKISDIKIKWIYSKDINRACALRNKYNISYHTNNYEDILNDFEVEIVDIANLPWQHIDFAELALKKKKNIITEKPIDVNLKKVREFYRKYYHSNQSILVVYQYPYSQTFRKLKEFINSKEYGKLKAYKITHFTLENKEYYDKWTLNPNKAGGGVLINQGIHYINLIYDFIGYSEMDIFASKQNITYRTKVEDTIFIQTRHKDGMIGSFAFSSGLPRQMKIELLFENTNVWTTGGRVIVEGIENKFIPTPKMGYFKDLIDDYLFKLTKNSDHKMNFKEAVMDLEIVLSSYRSAEKVGVVKFKVL